MFATAVLSSAALLTPAYANYNSGPININGTASDGRPVSGAVTFVYNDGDPRMSVYLQNFANPLGGISQTLTGVMFGVIGQGTVDTGGHPWAGTTIDTSTTGGSHNGWNCDKGSQGNPDTCTIANLSDSTVAAGWDVGTSGSNYTLQAHQFHPYGIVNDNITPTDGLTGSANHNPYILATTFVLCVSDFNDSSIDVSSVRLFFGTTGDSFTHAPEPGFYGVLALGLGSLAFIRRRKKVS